MNNDTFTKELKIKHEKYGRYGYEEQYILGDISLPVIKVKII